jgi:predicted transcriptional regulator
MEPPKRGRPRGRKVGTSIHVRLPLDMDKALRRIAEREDRPVAGLIRQGMRAYLAEEVAAMRAEELADAGTTNQETMPKAS